MTTRHAMWREANMKSNQFWAAVSKALAVMTVTLIMALMLAPGAWAAGKYKILHTFTGADGGASQGVLVFDARGNLYGTTLFGGDFGDGAVYKLTPNADGSWTESVLHSFNYSDGRQPNDGLVFDATGNLYGTASRAGAYGHGVVFKLAPNPDGSWTDSTIHDFKGGKDGGSPDHSDLIFDAAGNLYGVTAGWNGGDSNGTVFELTPNSDGTWTQSVLYNFRGGTDGIIPEGTLTFDRAGSLYGATLKGGAYGRGTIFKLTLGSDGKWTKYVLHQFRGGKDGSHPYAGVVFDTAGNLYGTTLTGGGVGPCSVSFKGCGTVFKLIPNSKGGWTEQMLHRFLGTPNNQPLSGVVLDASGNLYGTTSNQGSNFLGVVYEITP
jgi:uncharacterized repeat protein (TIGR03803 family)